jgi:outer membrane protein assembly factor BamE (lipoprotein component of BamABCDE complex)
MHKFIFFLSFLMVACSHSPVGSGVVSEQNNYNLSQVRVGMSQQQVASMMGRPYKTEIYETKETTYDIWFYITKKMNFGQTHVLPRNLTPLVFQQGILQGWGRDYYRHVTEEPRYQIQKEHAEEKQYTDDKDEWPADDHRMVPPQEKEEIEQPPQSTKPKKPKKEKDNAEDYLWWQ